MGHFPRSRAVIAAALLVAAGACSRDIASNASDGPPAPTSLGPISGFYGMRFVVPADGEHLPRGLRIPAPGGMSLLQLESPVDDVDPVIGVFDRNGTLTERLTAEGVQDILSFLDPNDLPDFVRGHYDGVDFTGELVIGEVPFAGRQTAGGGALTMNGPFSVCPGGDGYDIQAQRGCLYDPSLSGIYIGTEGACSSDAEGEPTILAAGFSGEFMLSMRYPQTDVVLTGNYDRFAQAGAGALGQLGSLAQIVQTLQLARWQMAEVGDQLELTVDLERTGSCERRMRVRRLSGGEFISCSAADVLGEPLGVSYAREDDAGARYLDIAVHFAGAGGSAIPADDASLQILVRSGPGGVYLPEVASGDPLRRRFELPAQAPAAGQGYEIFAFLQDTETEQVLRSAPAICFQDLSESQ